MVTLWILKFSKFWDFVVHKCTGLVMLIETSWFKYGKCRKCEFGEILWVYVSGWDPAATATNTTGSASLQWELCCEEARNGVCVCVCVCDVLWLWHVTRDTSSEQREALRAASWSWKLGAGLAGLCGEIRLLPAKSVHDWQVMTASTKCTASRFRVVIMLTEAGCSWV